MAKFISITQKKSAEVDLVKPLGQLLATYYGGEQTDQAEALETLNKLRKEATFKGIEGKASTTLNALQRYYDQIKKFTDKCPIDDVPINFKWKDSFERASYSFLPGSSTSQIIQSLAYERLNVLFNLGACYSEVAATLVDEDIHNDHALQIAAKHFQVAAGIFLALKTEVPAVLGQRCNHLDLNPSILNILHYLMLGQAQEVIVMKASSSMSDSSLSKIASQCSDYYDECHKLIQVAKTLWINKDWQNHIYSKHICYQAVSNYHQSAVLKANKKYGDEIAFLKHANENFETAHSRSTPSDFLQQYQKKISRRYEEAVKENNFIYHARIPDYNLLDSVERFSLVQPVPLANKFSPDSQDLFEGLLPLRVQQVMQKLDARKQEIVNTQGASLAEATGNLRAILASLNLPASLEDAPGVDLPQSLKDKSKYLRQKGGIQHVSRLIEELPDLLKRNTEILNEIEQSLANEEKQDNERREKYGKSKWTRQPSSKLNQAWKDHVRKYQETIKAAMAADEKVKGKFKNNEHEFHLLSSESPTAIAEAIPAGYQGHNCSNAPCVLKLRRLMADVKQLEKSREELEARFKNADFEPVKRRFLELYSSNDSQVNEASQIAEVLGNVFGPLEKEARDSLHKQEELVKEIQLTNDDFVELRGGSSSAAVERDQFFSRLATAYDAYNDLLKHLQEGTKFYNDLTQILVGLQTKVDDFVYSRRVEADELIKNLGDTPSSTSKLQEQPPSAPATGGGEQPAPAYAPYFPPPPLPNMPHSYNTYHPGAYASAPQGYYYPPHQGQAPYHPGYNTMPSPYYSHPPAPQNPPPSS